MSKFKITEANLRGILIIEPKSFADERGFFMEYYNKDALAELGFSDIFVQDNHSCSKKGVLRGLHYQLNPYAMGKLVKVVKGRIFDVGVDIRKGSPAFGKWFGAILSDADHKMLYFPPGFAHGFLVLSEVAEVLYKCTTVYNPRAERAIIWNDPEIGIVWPLKEIGGQPVLSPKDKLSTRLKDAETNFVFHE